MRIEYVGSDHERRRGNAAGDGQDRGRKPDPEQSAVATADDWSKLSQREKFIRTAREVGADETGEALDEALRAIGRARKR